MIEYWLLCNNNHINNELNEFIKNIEYITSAEFKKQISKKISDFMNTVNSSNLINDSDFLALILSSDDINQKTK